ncbi:MAG TPA: metal ABC transporter permease, partial [Chloroflexota bacterium]|nr:metal ABC transporter permease [Chloroflexota bacterium]
MFEPLQYDFMQNAYAAGTIIAVVVAVVGFFVVLRGLTFAGDALAHVGFTGAAGVILVGWPPIYGMFGLCVLGGIVMGLLGERVRGRDVAIGIVMAFALGLGALFLSLYTRYATEAFSILFGTILGVSREDLLATAIAGAVTLTVLGIVARPLLFASVDPEVAQARGVPVRFLSALFFVILAIAVAQAVQVVGVLLLLTMLVGPAATAGYLTHRPGRVVALSVGIALLETWAGITLAFYNKAPVSFFIAAISFVLYLAARFGTRRLAPARSK